MAVTPDEREAFGWLGRIPAEILDSSQTTVARYKRLSEDAERVAKMSRSDTKIKEAKKIERRYYDLITQAKREKK